ncbi:hypothetical protein BDZ90DRAFT_92493 [Jaminaea rosea]|uniref:Uncharacterized protein n=1 Tax=Jaminaea rosea TaxID=1569628 RepID=A0A316UPH6_9BASI|nr:hypothetical protein BDZ90DRAFT_92493 [Jaminaea rosea]PWN25035.1 hypothetical protein BDZ90DRAFT_92493 [Jaminaea rosea]
MRGDFDLVGHDLLTCQDRHLWVRRPKGLLEMWHSRGGEEAADDVEQAQGGEDVGFERVGPFLSMVNDAAGVWLSRTLAGSTSKGRLLALLGLVRVLDEDPAQLTVAHAPCAGTDVSRGAAGGGVEQDLVLAGTVDVVEVEDVVSPLHHPLLLGQDQVEEGRWYLELVQARSHACLVPRAVLESHLLGLQVVPPAQDFLEPLVQQPLVEGGERRGRIARGR